MFILKRCKLYLQRFSFRRSGIKTWNRFMSLLLDGTLGFQLEACAPSCCTGGRQGGGKDGRGGWGHKHRWHRWINPSPSQRHPTLRRKLQGHGPEHQTAPVCVTSILSGGWGWTCYCWGWISKSQRAASGLSFTVRQADVRFQPKCCKYNPDRCPGNLKKPSLLSNRARFISTLQHGGGMGSHKCVSS